MLIRKIQTRERAEILLGGCVIGPRGLFFTRESAEILFFAVNNNRCPPRPAGLVRPRKADALEARATVDIRAPIGLVLRSGAKPKVGPSVIKRISIDVVNLEIAWCRHDDSMHHGCHASSVVEADLSGRIWDIAAPKSDVPLELANQRKFGGVDHARKPSRQRNDRGFVHARSAQ